MRVDYLGLEAFVAVAGEIIANLEDEAGRAVTTKMVKGMMPTREDWGKILGPILRGTALGSLLGILPGGGAALASFAPIRWKSASRAPCRTFSRAWLNPICGQALGP
jgi:TctA family transporter